MEAKKAFHQYISPVETETAYHNLNIETGYKSLKGFTYSLKLVINHLKMTKLSVLIKESAIFFQRFQEVFYLRN